jgi:hypothetical protein
VVRFGKEAVEVEVVTILKIVFCHLPFHNLFPFCVLFLDRFPKAVLYHLPTA